jgi:prolyl-tRNA synthetase
MRRTALFCEPLRQNPADTEVAGHQLLLRGSYVQPLAAGIYSLLPLGKRVSNQIEQILREEMTAIDAQEVSMPVVHPAELWQESGRWYTIGSEMVRFKDRGHRDMILAMSHEEIVADLVRRQVRSYRQLPVVLYQIQTKFRDEPRSRGGLLRVREFVMKDAYSCHVSFEDLDAYYARMYQAYFNIFRRAGIEVISVEADVGMMGGTMAHEFMLLTDIGEDQIVLCGSCGHAANRQVATFRKDRPEREEQRPLQEVETPQTQTIASLARLLDIPESRTAKAAFFMAGDRLIFAVVRGDMEINETKLANAIAAPELRPARPDELQKAGIVPGYASPIGVEGVTVVVDDLVAQSPNLVAGANREGYHFLNTNYSRDYKANVVTDIVAAFEGAPCPRCGGAVHIVRGVEVGNIFKLGTRYSKAMGVTYLDEHGQSQYVVMGSYGIGVGRLMASVAEVCRDERGLVWPVTVTPFHVYLIGLDAEDDRVRSATESVYSTLMELGIEVLYDDRHERAGVKFNDADLLGMPLRVTVSRRTVQQNAVEVKPRAGEEQRLIPMGDAAACIKEELDHLHAEIWSRVKPEAFTAP